MAKRDNSALQEQMDGDNMLSEVPISQQRPVPKSLEHCEVNSPNPNSALMRRIVVVDIR